MVIKGMSIFVLRRGFLSSLILVLFSLVFVVTDSIASTWSIEFVDVPKYLNGGYSRAIAFDNNNNPHIVYGGDHLYYAYYDGNSWHYETADSSVEVGQYASLAIDSSGKAHISYYDGTNNGIKYATNASGEWVTTTIDNEDRWFRDWYTSLALDTLGKVHISYYYYDRYNATSNLRYATNTSGTWVTTTVDSDGSWKVGNYTSIALDSSDKAHISYSSDSGLKYSTNASGSWVATTIDSGTYVGEYTSIALDSSGKAHISYYDGTNYDLKYATNASGAWVTTTVVDSVGGVGHYTSLALDVSGKVHISYYASTNYDLKYATNASGEWVTTMVDSEGNVGRYTSLALDGSGRAHISYSGDSGLKYATNASGTWVTTIVDSVGGVGYYTSLALDASGKAHISYWDKTNYDLKYATNASGAWVTTTADSGGNVGEYTSIALDSSGKAHISYYDHTNYDLKYATNASGAWVTTTVDSGGDVGVESSIALDNSGKVHVSYDVSMAIYYATNASGLWITEHVSQGRYSSIALDTAGRPHISCYDRTYGGVFYASVSWVTTTVDSEGSVGKYTSLALDTSGKVHISYYDETNKDLKYAKNLSGTWKTTTVDSKGDDDEQYPSSGNVGQDASLALDTSGKVHISYFDDSNCRGKLRHATNTSGSWITETVDSYLLQECGVVGKNTSIKVDTSGKVHIAYYDQMDFIFEFVGALKYATNASGRWVKTTVDSEGWVGMYISLALDASGKVHISYYDVTNDDLKYATNASGSWVTTTVDNEGAVGLYTSIALDNSGKVHISYYDAIKQDLKYATDASGSWITTTVVESVDEGGVEGFYTSIALDSSDKVHISYSNYSDLKYATNASGSWVIKTIDKGEGLVGWYSSIALDATGNVHISYYDSSNEDLKYATNAIQSTACTPTLIAVSQKNMTIKVNENSDVPVTVKGKNGCLAEGVTVNVRINGAGKNKVSVSEESATTDENGEAKFAFTGIKKGKAKGVFSVDGLEKKEKITVKVK